MKFSATLLACAMAVAVVQATTVAPGTPGQTVGQHVCCTKKSWDVRTYSWKTVCIPEKSGWTGSGAIPDDINGGNVAECKPSYGLTKSIGYKCNKRTLECEPYTVPPTKPFCCEIEKQTSTYPPVTYKTCKADGIAYVVNGELTGSEANKCPGKKIPDGKCQKPPNSAHPVCDVVSPCDGPGGCGDPHIQALDGRSYLLWGKDAAVYNLLSERSHAVNIRLYTPATMKEGHALYIDAVGILIRSAKIAVRLVNPGEHVKGKPAPPPASLELSINEGPGLTFPGHPIDRAIDAYTSYSMRNPNKITITSRDIVLSVVLMENFYLDVLVDEVAAHWSNVHGILGQTHAAAFKLRYNYARGTAVGELPGDAIAKGKGKKYDIKGKEEDYITSGLLKTDDKFTRFEPSAAAEGVSKTRKLAEAVSVRERTNGAGVFV